MWPYVSALPVPRPAGLNLAAFSNDKVITDAVPAFLKVPFVYCLRVVAPKMGRVGAVNDDLGYQGTIAPSYFSAKMARRSFSNRQRVCVVLVITLASWLA